MKVDLRRRRLAGSLAAIFFLAMIMGAGPGIWLVNGRGPVFGIPVIYLWVVFWFVVQASAVVTAFLTIWKKQ